MTTKEKEATDGSEFERYRQVVGALMGVGVATMILLATSVARELLFRRPTFTSTPTSVIGDDASPHALLECNQLVMEQLVQLSATTNALLERPLKGPPADADDGQHRLNSSRGQRSYERGALAKDWKNFSTKWQDQWDVIDARCRFTELAGTNMGTAYDRMAHVYEALPAMRLMYNSLLARFDKQQAAELTQMRRALDSSREAISRQLNSSAAKRDETSPKLPPSLPKNSLGDKESE